MVNRKYAALAVAIVAWHGVSAMVTHVEIKDSGLAYEGRSEVEQEGCKLFRPTEKQLINYFNEAARTSEGGQTGKQYYSPCIATGKVTFKDGKSGRFTLQSSGFGSGNFGDREVIYFFRKDNPWLDPFRCTYAMSDEVEPDCK